MANVNFGYEYPRPAVTTDCVIFGFDAKRADLKILTIERGIDPFRGKLALPGGFLRINATVDDNKLVVQESSETLLECAKRELFEETGLEVRYIDELGTFSTPNRDPRCVVITDAYFALVPLSPVRGGDDAYSAKWLSLAQVLDAIDHMPKGMRFLAFDHDEIVKRAYTRLQEQLFFKPIGFSLLPEQFSMTALQRIYEAILGREFDRRNFSRKMLDSGVLDELPHAGRNKYYTLNKEKYEHMLHNGRIRLWF